jgi:hypothetical protein
MNKFLFLHRRCEADQTNLWNNIMHSYMCSLILLVAFVHSRRLIHHQTKSSQSQHIRWNVNMFVGRISEFWTLCIVQYCEKEHISETESDPILRCKLMVVPTHLISIQTVIVNDWKPVAFNYLFCMFMQDQDFTSSTEKRTNYFSEIMCSFQSTGRCTESRKQCTVTLNSCSVNPPRYNV